MVIESRVRSHVIHLSFFFLSGGFCSGQRDTNALRGDKSMGVYQSKLNKTCINRDLCAREGGGTV